MSRRAASRWKLERGKVVLSHATLILAILEAGWAILLIFKRSWIAPFPVAAGAVAVTLILIIVHAWLRRADPKTIHRAIDRRLHLPDMTLSAGELSGESAWLAQLREKTLARTASVNWREIWPVPWPKWTGYATFGCVALFSLLAYLYVAEVQAQRAFLNRPVPRDLRAEAIETLFKDWDQEKIKDEELKKMMEKIAPLRDRLTAPQTSEKEKLMDICRLEEIVAAEKAKLDAQSLEPQAANIADALQPMEGMSALAAALRKKDFEKAAEQAKQAAEKLGAEKAEVPKGAKEAGNAAEKLAQQLGKKGQKQMSQSLSQLSEGAKEGDSKKMSGGMQGLKEGFSKQAAGNAERKRLATQLAQLGFAKNPGDGKEPGEGQNPGMSLMPRLSSTKQPGKGVGSETDLNRFGAETKLASERHAESMNNTVTEGESEKTTIKATEGQSEATRATRAVTFQEYQQLSQQAIADEAIPAAHREAIKRYFEKIRPDAGK